MEYITEICSLSDTSANEEIYERAAEIIKSGSLVAFPTETVYGLGGDATYPDAARKIYAAKGRPGDNPLIIHVAAPEDADKYAVTTELYYRLARRFMPGPLTVIMPKRDIIPYEVTGGLDTVAVRCPGSQYAREFIKHCGVPIAAPSANLSGSPSPTTAKHVYDDMCGRIPMILDGGPCEIGLESTVISLDGDGCKLLRPGAVTEDMLLEVCSHVEVARAVIDPSAAGDKPASPGMKYKHYSPKAEFTLVEGDTEAICRYLRSMASHGSVGVICADRLSETYAATGATTLTYGSDETGADLSRSLFSLLRRADELKLSSVVARAVPPQGEYMALYNRMIRAAGCRVVRLGASDNY